MLQQNSIVEAKTSLRERVIKAGSWTLVSYATDISARFISNLIITRLLFPEAFGLMAAATALIVSLTLMSDVGVRTFIIQSQHGESPSILQSAWTFQCIRGAVLWIILTAGASLLFLPALRTAVPDGTVFANRLFPPVVIVFGLSLLVTGFESTATFLNVRRLNFRPAVMADLSSRVIALCLTITSVYVFQSVWSLVLGGLSGPICKVVLSHIIIPGPKMRLSFRQDHFREIISFGKWINVSSWATFAISQSDVLILGFLVPARTLGVYYIAKSLVDAVEGILERLNSSLTLPVLGEVLRRDPMSMKQQYYRLRMPLELVAFTASGFLLAAGDWIINFLYDPRYSAAGISLRILSLGLLLYPFQLIRSGFTAAGRPQVQALATVVQAASLTICIAIGYYLCGPVGAIAGISTSRLFPSVVLISFASRVSWVSISRELRFLPIFLVGLVAGRVVATLFASITLSNLRQFF